MLPDDVTAAFLAAFLAFFFGANLLNLWRSQRSARAPVRDTEVEHPTGLRYALAALCTLVFFAEAGFYVLLVFFGMQDALTGSVLQLRFSFDWYVQAVGLVMVGSGFLLFVWSVLARGRYASAWAMREDQKLVTWGPYRFVRHPSYFAYFLLFIGLPLTLLNLVTVVPLIGIPGYVYIARVEEELLVARFGDEYSKYQQTTGKFLPRLQKSGEREAVERR